LLLIIPFLLITSCGSGGDIPAIISVWTPSFSLRRPHLWQWKPQWIL
jgi:hypothetical protein